MATTAPAKKTSKTVWPKALGKCADMLYEMRQKRLVEQKVVDGMEAQEKALKEHLIQNLPKSEASGVSGALANVKVYEKDVPQVEDWDAFYAHILKTKDFGFLNRALNKAYVEEWMAANPKKGLPPGVKLFNAITVSCTKV